MDNKVLSLHYKLQFIILFVCLVFFFVPLENFSIIWRRHHCRRRATDFGLCSTPKSIEQWGFFSVPLLLWHGASVYIGHLWGPVVLTPTAKRLAVELSLPVLTTWDCRCLDSNTQPSACEANALTDCATAAVSIH